MLQNKINLWANVKYCNQASPEWRENNLSSQSWYRRALSEAVAWLLWWMFTLQFEVGCYWWNSDLFNPWRATIQGAWRGYISHPLSYHTSYPFDEEVVGSNPETWHKSHFSQGGLIGGVLQWNRPPAQGDVQGKSFNGLTADILCWIHQFTEVKQHWARTALGWETTWEVLVVLALVWISMLLRCKG